VFVNRFYAPDISATSQILTDLTRQLTTHGFQVHVVCSRLRYEGADEMLPARDLVDGVHVHRVWSTGFGRRSNVARLLDYLSFYPTALIKLAVLLRAGDVVVAKTDPPLLSVIVGPVARLRSATPVNWLQDVFPEIAERMHATRLPRFALRVLQRLRDRSLRRAGMNVVLGAGMRDYFRRRDIPDCRLRIVENWAIGEPGNGQPVVASELRESLGFDGSFIVGYNGNLGQAHDYSSILAAASILQDDPDCRFLMVGGGAGMRELEARVRAAGLANVTFLPYQPREQVTDTLAAADVHLVTLLPEVEGLIVPSKLYGVMAVGRPIVFIGDAQGEVARVLRAADCGTSMPCGDGARLAGELLRLKRDPALRSRLGANAASAYRENFSFDHAARRWVDLLRELGC